MSCGFFEGVVHLRGRHSLIKGNFKMHKTNFHHFFNFLHDSLNCNIRISCTSCSSFLFKKDLKSCPTFLFVCLFIYLFIYMCTKPINNIKRNDVLYQI